MKIDLSNIQRGTLSVPHGILIESAVMQNINVSISPAVSRQEEVEFCLDGGPRHFEIDAGTESRNMGGETPMIMVTGSRAPGAIPELTPADMIASRRIPTSQTVTGIEVRLSKVLIKDNKTPSLGPFIKYSNLYVITSSLDNISGKSHALTLKGFSDVDDGEVLPVDKTIYYWKSQEKNDKIPGAIHVCTSILKSNEKIRNFGTALASLRDTDDFKSLTKKAIATAAGGAAKDVEQALLPLIGIVGEILGKIDDKPLFTNFLSFTDINGDLDQLGRHRFARKTRYADVVTTLIIRDASLD